MLQKREATANLAKAQKNSPRRSNRASPDFRRRPSGGASRAF
jgi:hypothetical protein